MVLRRLLPLLLLPLALRPAPAALLGAWDAGDLSGATWRDASGGGHDAALTAFTRAELDGRPTARAGAKGQAKVAAPLGDGAAALSLVAIVNLEQATGSSQGVAGRDCFGGVKGDVYGLVVEPGGRWAARLVTARGEVAIGAPATPGWHQVAMTYDGATLRLVIDGQEAAQLKVEGPLVSEPTTPFALGGYANAAASLRGALARVELHDGALTPETLAGAWAAWLAAHPVKDDFWFAEASDIHLNDTRSVELINDAVDQINGDPRMAFSLWAGDLTESSQPDQMILARLALARLQRPAYTVRGNHDQAPGVYEAQFGPLRRRFTYGGWEFLLIDTDPGDTVPVSAADREWLSAQLATIPAATPIVLVGHHPLMPHTKSYRVAGADEVLALFRGHNLKACLAGHFHGNQEETADGVLFTTTACLSSTRENHDGTTVHGYRRFHCAQGQLTTEFVPCPQTAKALP